MYKPLFWSLCWALALASVGASLADLHAIKGGIVHDTTPNLRRASTTTKHSKITSIEKTLQNHKFPIPDAQGLDGVDVTCTNCYVTGSCSASLTFASNSNIDTSAVHETIKSFWERFKSHLPQMNKTYVKSLAAGTEPVNVDMRLNTSEIHNLDFPTLNASFAFKDLDIYMVIKTKIPRNNSITINLYTSEWEGGIEVAGQELGLVLSIDLILSNKDAIDISSGFHIKMNDEFTVDASLFSMEASHVHNNGGKFEFLPKNISMGTNTQLNATLQVSLFAGINSSISDSALSSMRRKLTDFQVSSGVYGVIFTNIATLITDISSPSADDNACSLDEIPIVEAYGLAVGADAAATVALAVGSNSTSWGPAPSTSTQIWSTTLATTCGSSISVSSTPEQTTTTTTSSENGFESLLAHIDSEASSTASDSSLHARAFAGDESITTAVLSSAPTTYTIVITHTMILCPSSSISCPPSLQSTSLTSSTRYLTTDVPSLVMHAQPRAQSEGTTGTDVSPVLFGTNAVQIEKTSGIPSAYTSGAMGNFKDGGGPDKTALGVGLGLGIPFFLAFVAGFYWLYRKRSRAYRQVHLQGGRDESAVPIYIHMNAQSKGREYSSSQPGRDTVSS